MQEREGNYSGEKSSKSWDYNDPLCKWSGLDAGGSRDSIHDNK